MEVRGSEKWQLVLAGTRGISIHEMQEPSRRLHSSNDHSTPGRTGESSMNKTSWADESADTDMGAAFVRAAIEAQGRGDLKAPERSRASLAVFGSCLLWSLVFLVIVAAGPVGAQSDDTQVAVGEDLRSLSDIVPVHCAYPRLPRTAEPRETVRTQLEAAGLWRRNLTEGRTPPANPQVGDTWLWYIWDLGGYPTASLKPCTVRGMGDHSYVVVDDDEWNVSINQSDVDRIVSHFEDQSVGAFPDQGIWDLNTSHFGDPPNPLDGLDRVFLLYYRFDISADGYFWVFDQFPDGSMSFSSNEADVIYLATDNGDPGGDYMLAVAAHEFQHLIHYNHDSNEDSWVDEGLGELAMWLFGNPDTISGFNSNPDNDLTDWGAAWADYIQTYLWTLYAYEQFGGQSTIWDLVHEPTNGMIGYLNTLTEHGYVVLMEDIFGDWSVANFLDDPDVQDGRYGYNGETLPPFFASAVHNTYPATRSSAVQRWATDYIRLTDFGGAPVLDFDGDDSRQFRISMMALDPVLPTIVQTVDLDTNNDGYHEFTEAAGYSEVIVSVANVYRFASATYSYTVDAVSELVFADGFESGDTTAWSTAQP